jgi:RNA polymerase sigma-70 factor (ECF subfamily)
MSTPRDERELFELLRAGDQQAARDVVDAYTNRLLALARARISQRMARRIDPEDILQSVFRTFFGRVKAGRFTIEGQDDLAKLLVGITVRKTLRQVAFHRAAKRDPDLEKSVEDSASSSLPELPGVEPSPEATVTFLDLLEHFLSKLRPRDRQIIEMRFQGYSNDEIAQSLGTSDRQVRRAVEHIRAMAEQEDLGPKE